MIVADSIARVITDRAASTHERRMAHDWMLELLSRPFGAAEAAEKLGISKPTAIKWLRAGLIRRPEGADRDELVFDAASVLGTREILQRLKMTGTVAERARVIAELPERLFWTTNSAALSALESSVREANRGKVTPVSEADLERGRALLEARRQQRRRIGRQRRTRPGAAE